MKPSTAIKAPISVQIYYVLSMLAMAIVLASVVVIGFFASQSSEGITVSTVGIMLFLAAIFIYQFYLTDQMKKGKLNALIKNTALQVISAIYTIWAYYELHSTRGVLAVIITIIFFVIFWTKDRNFFNSGTGSSEQPR